MIVQVAQSRVFASAVADAVTPAAGQFVPVPAANLVTSLQGVGWSGKIQPGTTKNVTATGVGGVPSTGVSAVLLQVSTWGSTSTSVDNGTLTVYPTGSQIPTFATLANAPSGTTADNSVIVQVGTNGQISFYDGPSAQAVQVNADIEGYVTSSGASTPGATFAT